MAYPFRDTEGECGFDDEESFHDSPCHQLVCGGDGCPMLSTVGLCRIYATRPNVCVDFCIDGAKCRELREAANAAKGEDDGEERGICNAG